MSSKPIAHCNRQRLRSNLSSRVLNLVSLCVLLLFVVHLKGFTTPHLLPRAPVSDRRCNSRYKMQHAIEDGTRFKSSPVL